MDCVWLNCLLKSISCRSNRFPDRAALTTFILMISSSFSPVTAEARHFFSKPREVSSTEEQFTERIYNGNIVKYQDYPYFARVKSSRGRCGGVMIEQRYLITSAHCLPSEGPITVKFGPRSKNNTAFEAELIMSRKPANFRPTERFEFDLALLRLINHSRPIDSCLSLPPPYLDLMFIDSNEMVFLLGSGKSITAGGRKINDTMGVLKRVDTTVSQISCSKHGYFPNSLMFTLCFGYSPDFPGQSFVPCAGDSGGPTVIRFKGRSYLAGITSTGRHNCQNGFDDSSLSQKILVHLTRISPHTPAILHEIDKHSHTHNQVPLMEIWMVNPDMLPNHLSSLWLRNRWNRFSRFRHEHPVQVRHHLQRSTAHAVWSSSELNDWPRQASTDHLFEWWSNEPYENSHYREGEIRSFDDRLTLEMRRN